jgi:dTDP-glucose 4,6-dehydratase
MSYQPRTVLVTGGAGFIGSVFVQHLLQQDPKPTLVNLDALTYAGKLQNLKPVEGFENYQFVQGNISDQKLIKSLLIDHQVDTIVHLAAESHVDRSISGPEAFLKTNVEGTYSLLESARQVWLGEKKWTAEQCRFHHVSTDEVYGTLSAKDPAFSELTPYAPNSPYSASKAASDHWVRAYHHTYDLPVTISNCSNNYGPYQHEEKLIPTVILSCRNRQPIPVYGDGSNVRDWLYVGDHCEAIDLICREGQVGESYNVGGDSELSNLELVKMICQEFDRITENRDSSESLISFVTDRPGHDWRYAINHDKISNELGWQPRTQISQGLQQTIRYYLDLEK